MERIATYRQIIRDFLSGYAERNSNDQLVFDQEHDRYLVLHNEWRGHHRIYGCAIQLDIIDGQVWIQENNTEIYVDQELIQRGVAERDIILGFRSPGVRDCIAAALKSHV